MDPLTIATGVITILQATTTLISICYDYRAALKDEPWTLTDIIAELKALRNIIETLEDSFQRSLASKESKKADRWPSSLSNMVDGPLVTCQRELWILDKKIRSAGLGEAEASKRGALLKALKWQLKEKDVKECLERIERCKSTLILALQEDQMYVAPGFYFLDYLLNSGKSSA